ncbi:MAG TPA: electron transport complex subunit RsxC [Firmicutes bacterium]|nr:electron transport complex subunit RsxC [Bacillota bacterium]
MFVKKFPGGIHPKYNKELTADKPIVDMPLPKTVRLLLTQHLGPPCSPVVAPGDKVAVGQKIADTDAFVAAPIIASVAGEVTAVDAEGIDIVTDQENSGFTGHGKIYASPAELRQLIREAGIVGMGGATFPTHVKLTPPEGKSVSTLILNGAECEPFLTTDHRLMVEQGQELVLGIKLLMEACGAKTAIIGIEANKPDAIANITDLTREFDNISVVSVPVRYPQGGERQLIKTLTGREVPVGGLPLDLGIVVSNVATAVAVHQAVSLGRPLIDRVVTVSGRGIAEPKNVRVRLGTPIAELIDFCGGLTADAIKVINGGPMMGKAVADLNSPVTKGTSGILAFTEKEAREYEERTCIRCASCVDACPQKLLPNYLALYSRKVKLDLAEQFHLFNCIECGCCSYVCPSRIPIVKYIQTAKNKIKRRRRK